MRASPSLSSWPPMMIRGPGPGADRSRRLAGRFFFMSREPVSRWRIAGNASHREMRTAMREAYFAVAVQNDAASLPTYPAQLREPQPDCRLGRHVMLQVLHDSGGKDHPRDALAIAGQS